MSFEIGDKLLTPKQAAEILLVHEHTVRRMCDSGILTALRLGQGRHRRIPERDVNRLKSHMLKNNGRYCGD